jgi:uncharacterized membrane protein
VKPTSWLGIIILYTAITILFTHFIPSDSPLAVFRYIFGFIFISTVPGYCLVNLLFREGKLDLVEKAVLSVALSFSIVGVAGLFLGLSPIGMTTASLTSSLSIIVAVLALLAFIRKRKSQTPSIEQATDINIEKSP